MVTLHWLQGVDKIQELGKDNQWKLTNGLLTFTKRKMKSGFVY